MTNIWKPALKMMVLCNLVIIHFLYFLINIWDFEFFFSLKDIEEELDVLDIQSQEKLTDKNNNDNNNLVISSYEKKLKESEAKIDELVDVVSKLRYEPYI